MIVDGAGGDRPAAGKAGRGGKRKERVEGC